MKIASALMLIAALALPVLAEEAGTGSTGKASRVEADNTGRNVRDRETLSLTPVDQGSNEADLKTTQSIRKALMDAEDLSMAAKNVKVITSNGQVTLRGPVKTAAEKSRIEAIAKQMTPAGKVDNQLEIKADTDAADKAGAGAGKTL